MDSVDYLHEPEVDEIKETQCADVFAKGQQDQEPQQPHNFETPYFEGSR